MEETEILISKRSYSKNFTKKENNINHKIDSIFLNSINLRINQQEEKKKSDFKINYKTLK